MSQLTLTPLSSLRRAVRRAMFGLSLHPWLAGMAHRIRYIDEALARVVAVAPARPFRPKPPGF